MKRIFALFILVTLAAAGNLFAAAAETNRPAKKDFNDFKLLQQRNIFDPNRRPLQVWTPRTNAPVYWFALAGTMNYDKGVFAVFDGSSSDYHKVLEAGGKIANYSVTAI